MAPSWHRHTVNKIIQSVSRSKTEGKNPTQRHSTMTWSVFTRPRLLQCPWPPNSTRLRPNLLKSLWETSSIYIIAFPIRDGWFRDKSLTSTSVIAILYWGIHTFVSHVCQKDIPYNNHNSCHLGHQHPRCKIIIILQQPRQNKHHWFNYGTPLIRKHTLIKNMNFKIDDYVNVHLGIYSHSTWKVKIAFNEIV